MFSIENNINSYDTGGKPFQHDSGRGKWKSLSDFYLGCIGHAFGMKCFSIIPFFIQFHGGILFVIPYTIAFFLFAFPIFVIQSFLGQFSGTGFISVFRISPLFKGIGYVILVLNIVTACYFSAITAYPLAYFFASFSPELPWMSCNHTFNTPNCTEKAEPNVNGTESIYHYHSWCSTEYFAYGISNFLPDDEEYTITRIAWPIFFCTILIWIILGAIFYKGFERVNQAIRWCTYTAFLFFGIFFVRIICLPGALTNIWSIFTPTRFDAVLIEGALAAPYITVFIFGNGWGTVLTMASYNSFRADIMCYSKAIGFIILILFTLSGLAVAMTEEYLDEYLNFYHYRGTDNFMEYVVVALPYLIGHLEASNMWAMIFFMMMFLFEFCGLIIQILSITTAIFDEYEKARENRTRITLLIIACIGLGSLFFTTNKDIFFYVVLASFSGLTQMCICFLELIVVVWFYGRERFQRDLQFMLGKAFATWKFFLIRFITPLFTLINVLIFLAISVASILYMDSDIFEIILIIIVKVFPWICIPAYIGIKLANTTGSLYHRLKKSIWPTDWYPADPLHRQRYEEYLGTSDIAHQLVIMKPDSEEES